MVRLPVRKWLTYGGLLATAVGGMLTGTPFWAAHLLPDDFAYGFAPMLGLVIAAPAFLLLCVGVRCDKCSYKLFWHAVSNRSHPTGLVWFFSSDRCARCGYARTS